MTDSSFELSEDLKRFIHHEVSVGRFRSAAEVIEAGLLLLEERETRLAALRSMIAESDRASSAPDAPGRKGPSA
jgi:antitoxin ParD1/3/4